MAGVQEQVDAWLQSPQGEKKVLQVTGVDASSGVVSLRLHGHPLSVTLPADSECLFELECDAADLSEVSAILATFAFEQEDITLAQFLDKLVSVYQKLFPSGDAAAATTVASSATAAAKTVSGSRMDIDDEGGFSDAGGDMYDDDAGFGDGDADGDGWGDFTEANADEEIHDDAWAKSKALKKRLIARAEAVRVEAAHATEQQKQGKDGIKTIFSSEAAVTMLVNDCMTFMDAADAAVKVRPVDDSVFTWDVQLANFPADSAIQRGLAQLQAQFGYSYVELEVKFMPDLYPFFPPTVRLVRPRMKNFMIGRLVCLPELQLNQWNPTRTLHDIFDTIRRVLTSFGEVDDTDPTVNDPDSELQPYTALEFELLRLTMLTDIAPRVVKTMGDVDAIKLFAPKLKPKEEKSKSTPEEAEEVTAAPSYHYSPHGHAAGPGFRKGTGYGGGQRDSAGWDVDAWKAAQVKKESEICEIAHSLAQEMAQATVPPSLAVTLEQSCLLPFLQQYLANDSISDMESHSVIYHSVLDICKNMARHETLVRLFDTLPGERYSLAGYMQQLKSSASVVAKFERFNPKTSKQPAVQAEGSSTATTTELHSPTSHVSKKSKTSSAAATVDKYPISLLKHIMQVADIVETAMATLKSKSHLGTTSGESSSEYAAAASSSSAAAAASSAAASSSSSSSAATAATADYVETLLPYRFGEVEEFTSHHYFKQYGASSSALSRQWVKRLATEYADLSKSLPIHPLSSTWLRYKEDAMAFSQFLIAAPDETPYGYGMFLFDAYFPNQYPNVPPLVNLQTTGNGTVRFNPNLYNCGKVCLSLLGTWSGAAGETWTALTSTFLQVIVSIQSLILVPDPYFNEPGFQSSYGTPYGKTQSETYNRAIEVATIKYAMLDMMKKPPSWATEIVRAHFCLHREDIMKQCRGWATKNKEVEQLLPALQAALDQQMLPDGSRPVCATEANQSTTGTSDNSAAAATSPASTAAEQKPADD